MTVLGFFAASGVIAWLFLVWRAVRSLRSLKRRLWWAVFGAPRPRRASRA